MLHRQPSWNVANPSEMSVETYCRWLLFLIRLLFSETRRTSWLYQKKIWQWTHGLEIKKWYLVSSFKFPKQDKRYVRTVCSIHGKKWWRYSGKQSRKPVAKKPRKDVTSTNKNLEVDVGRSVEEPVQCDWDATNDSSGDDDTSSAVICPRKVAQFSLFETCRKKWKIPLFQFVLRVTLSAKWRFRWTHCIA